jgi:exosortase A
MSFIDTWMISNTYGHGFIILPIVIWLVFQRKSVLSTVNIAHDKRPLILLLCLSPLWFVAWLSQINVVIQFVFISLLVVLVWTFWGIKLVQQIKFPLAFLFFSIPVGDFLIPYLQFITADIAVWLLHLVNVPVYREGMYIQIPNGNFHVAEACSGIRFLISTVTLSVLFAYLYLKTLWKQIAFVLLSILVSIVGNGIRAFLMILIGHLSNMQAAVGFDHLVYGWVFFTIILVCLYWIGLNISKTESWTNESVNISLVDEKQHLPAHAKEQSVSQSFLILVIVIMAIGPMLQQLYWKQIDALKQTQVEPTTVYNISNELDFKQWHAQFVKADYYDQYLLENDIRLDVITYSFEDEKTGKEIISYENTFFDADLWSLKKISTGKILTEQQIEIPYQQLELVNLIGDKRILRISYRVENQWIANKLSVKVAQLKSKLLLKDLGGQVVIISAKQKEDAVERLDKFMQFRLIQLIDSHY